MKIGIITCHDVYNYGASLQAYALQTFLLRQGHNVCIINYQPAYLSFHYKLSFYIPNSVYQDIPSLRIPIVKWIYCCYRYFLSLKTLKRKRRFDKFTCQNLKLTKKYTSPKDLIADPPKCDMYIAGSDQIWNSAIMENGKDEAFYLSFVKDKSKKISYAASFGSVSISETYSSHIREWLADFNHLSVREESGREIIENMGLSATTVCDPVFLLNSKDWQTSTIATSNDPYLLIYTIGDLPEKILEMAKKIAYLRGLKVYAFTDIMKQGIDKCLYNSGPYEFVDYIKKSDFVISNSFHATSFSIIFNKQFLTFQYHSKSNSARMINLLNLFDLNERFEVWEPENLIDIDYCKVNRFLESYQNAGRSWLIDALNK